MASKNSSVVKQLKKNANKKPKVETNRQKLGKRQGYLYNVGKSITYAAVEKIKQMNPVISDFSDTNNDLFKTIYKSAIDYRVTYKRGLDVIMKSKFYEAADIGLTALKEDIMTGNLYNKERLEKLEMKQMGLDDIGGSGFDDNFSVDLGDLDNWEDDFSDFDNNLDTESTDSSSKNTNGTAVETLATINSIENTSEANANTISMAVARSAEYASKVNIKNTNLLYTQNTRAFGIMNGHLDAMNSNIGSVMEYLNKNLTPHLSNSTEFFTNTSKALQDQVSLLREIAENTRKIEATTNNEEGNKNKIGYSDVVDAGGMPDLVTYGKTIMKNSNSYLNELTGGAWNMMMQGIGENSNMLALFAANPYGALLSSMINRMTPKDLEKAFNNMNKTIGGFFASMITKLNTMANSEDSMIDKMLGKVFGIKNTPKSSVDVSQYDKGKVDWNGKSQKALTEVIPQQLSKILSALTGSQESTFNYETGKFVTYDEMKKEFDNMKNSFWKNAASEPMQEIREIANKNLAFGSKEEYDQFFKDLEKLFETSYNKGEIIDYQKNNFNEKYLDYGVSEKNLLAIQSILRELPRNIMMQYNADMQDQYTNQTRRFKEIEKSGQYAYLFNNANHNQFAKELNGKKNKKAEKTSFNTNLLLDTKDNYGKNIFFYMQSMYKELNYMRRITAQGFGGGGNIQGSPLDLVQDYNIVDADGNVYKQTHDRGFKSLSQTAIKDTRSENEKMSESVKKALERDRANKSFLRQQARRMEKGELLVNISDLDDESVRGAVRNNVQTNKNKDKLKEEAEKEQTEFDKLKEEMGLSGKSFSAKFDKLSEKAQKYIKRPSSIMTDLAVKVDQGLFELIYGKEGENGKKSVKGILDHLIFEMKKSFSHFNDFMDEKILNPLKDRLGLDKDKGLIKGIYGKLSEMFGLDEKKQGAKDFFKQVREKMTDTLKGIGTSITDSVKDVFSPLTDLFKSKNFFDKKKKDNNNQDEFDEDDITTTVTKILRNYDFDNYDNLNGKEKFDKTKRSIEHARRVQSGESNNINEMFDMNNIKLELKELDEETKNLKDIKEYRSLNMTVMSLRQQIISITKDLNDYKSQYLAMSRSRNKQQQIKAKKVKSEIKKCKNTIVKLNDRLDKAMKRLKEMRDNNQNIEQDIQNYDDARKNIINKNNFNKYDIGQRQNILNEQAYEYFQSSEFKNLSIEEQRRIAEEMMSGKDKNIVDQLKKSQDRLKELEKQNGTEIGRFRNFNGVTKDGKKTGMRKVNTELLQKIEKQKIDKLTKQIEQSIRSNDMSLPALRYLATLDNRYEGLLSEVSLNGESEDLNKQIAEIEKMIQIGESNLEKNDPRSIAGLDLQYDKTAKEKLLDSFSGILGNEDGDMYDFVSKSIDKLFKDRDSNYANNFEGITIRDILGQKDNVINDISKKKDAAIRAKQKIYDKKGVGYRMSENAPANKRINELSRQIEEAEYTFNELAKFITNTLGLKEDGTIDVGNGVEDIEALDAFDRIKKYNQSKSRPENQQDRDRPWSDNLTEGGSKFITDNKFIKESMQTQTSTTESIDSTLKQILNLLQGTGNNKNQYKPGPRLTPFIQNPLRNIEAGNEQAVLNDFMDGLTTDIQNAVKGYFGRVGIPGFAKGGIIDKDQLAIVGKGETVVPSLTDDKRNQIANQIREAMGKVQSGKWKDNKVHDQAKYLYQNIAAVMGADNVDPNIIISMLGRSGEVGNDFANLDNEDQQKHFVKIAKITQQALNQRNEGVINNSGNQTDKGVVGDYTNIFSETFQIYKRAINKTMEAIVGDDDGKKDKKVSANAMKEVMSEAKIYGPDVVSGALLGGGASLLTGFIGGPLLGAAVGSGIALTKNSTKVQAMLFGEKEFDKDGNYVGRKGGLLPKDFVNTVAKTFPDMKKYGIVGLLSGFTALNPLGPVPGLLIGSALGVAKNNATIQSRLFGETGIIGEDRWNKFKKNLPNILAGAGVGFGLNMLNLTGPFGVLGSILIGSALGYASTTDKFKEMIFGTYNPQTGEQEGGLIGFVKDKIFSPFINWAKRDILKPLKDAFKPITKQIGIMFKTVFGGIAKGVINFFTKTLVVPIREKVGKFLSTIFSPFKNLGKRLLGTVGRIISAPARALGGIGRATQRHQIRVGTADDMTAEERLNYMNNQNEMDFFYDQSQKIKRDSFNNAAEEMEKRFGKKDANKLKLLMRSGFHDQAQDLIKKRFGDVKDEESKKVMQNMLKDTSNYKKYYGSRILRDTYYERKEAADNVRNQVDEQFEAYKKANPDSKVTRDEFLQNLYGDKYNKKVRDNGYNNDEADKILASMTNDQLGEFVNQYKAFGVTDKEYEKNKKKAGKEITALLKNMNIGANGKLKIKDRNIILGGLNYGQSEMAINYLRNLAKDQGIKLDDNADFNKIMDIMNEYKITEDLRLDKEKGKNAYERKVKELAGNSTTLGKELSLDTFGKLAISEDRLRNLKGKVITPEDIKDEERNKKITEIIQGITDLNKSLTDKQDETNKLLEQIRDFKTEDEFQQRRANSKIELDAAVHRDEQELSKEQKKRQILLRRIGVKSLDDQPDFVRKMSLPDLQSYVKKYRSVSRQDIMKQYREEAEAKKDSEEEVKQKQDETAVERIKKSVDTTEVKDGLPDDMKKSILDNEGNEVVMKRDSKTGQYEADTADSSTRKSVKIAQRLREKQEAFYDSFSGLFKKNDKEEDEEKKSGGWLSKMLMALGLGKSLLGKAKGLLGGILGRGAIGGLFSRGIFGTIGKGALVIGGLMYLPEIIDLFKTKIGPAISENWDSTIKPWLTEEALPRLKDGLVLLVQEIPSLLKGTVKFIGSELIPSILKGMGWDIGTDKDEQEVTYDENGNPVNKGGNGTTSTAAVVGNTAIRSLVRKGARYASAVKSSVSKNIAKEGSVKTLTKSLSKEGVEKITEGAVKSGFKGGAKDVAKAGFKTAKDFILHPVKTSVKGVVKGAKAATNAGGKILGNTFLKIDAKRIAKGGSLSNKMEGKILTNVANSGLMSQLINFCKNQFTKLFTNSTVVNLLGKAKNIPVAKAILEKAVPKMLEAISKGAAKMSGTALARVVGGIGTGGLVTLGFAVYDFISGFKDARNIMGITEDNVPFGYRIISGVVKTIQGLSIIATLLPTKTIMSILISVLSSIGVDMGNIKQQQEKAQQELKEYNEKNGTNFSLEEYNKEVKGHKGLFDKAKDTVKWAGGKITEAGKWVGNGAGKLLNGVKSLGGKTIKGLQWINDNGINWAGDKMAGAITAIGNGATQLWDGAKWLGGQALNGLATGGKMLETGFNNAKNWTGNMLLSGVKGGANLAAKGLSWVANDIVNTPKTIESLYNTITDWGKNILDGLGKKLSGWYDKNIRPTLDAIGDKFNNVKEWCSKFIENPIKTIGEGFQNLLDWFKEKFSWITNSKDWVTNKWNDAKQSAGNAWNSIKNGVKNAFTKKASNKTNTNVSNIKTVNGMKVGQGEYVGKGVEDIKNDIKNSDLGTNVKDATSDYAKDRIKSTVGKYTIKGLSKISTSNVLKQSTDAGMITKILNKIKAGIQYVLNTKTVINILGQAKNGESIAKILYDNFVPRFMQLATQKLQKAMPEVVTRLSSKILSGGMTSFAFAVTDFITGFENAESILGIVDNATIIEKIIAAILEALKGFSIFSIVPSDLVVSLLFDVLETAGVATGNIGEKRAKAKTIVANYNKKNNTSYNVSSYNSKVLGRKGFFSSIASTVSNGLSKVSSFFGKGEGDVVNGNPYFSQKQASGQFGQMINDAGCGPTSTAMALSKVTGKNISPESIAKDAYQNKTWDSEGARGNMFATEAKKYGVKTVSSGGNFEKFDKMVSAGIPTAVSGTLGKGEDSPYTKAGHIVTVFGKDKNGNYLVNDPRGKKYSKAYTKEELMNGFRDSWSFGKGDDDSSNSVPSTEKVIGNVKNTIKSVSPAALTSSFRKKSTLILNRVSKSISGSGMIESASKVLEEVFTKIFNNDTIINLLGDDSSSQYSAASVLLGNFVPQVIKKLKMNCEKNKSINLNRYLRAIVSNANVNNISFLISNFVNAFNNPAKYIGNYDTYTTGMKTCAAILATINERFVIDKLLPSSDWSKLIQDYVMPVFGEGTQDIDTLKKQADKIVKEFNLKSMSTNATTDTITSIAENLTGSTSASGGILSKVKNGAQSLFSKVTGGVKNVVHNVSSGVKNVVKKAGQAVGNVYNNVKNAVSSSLNWISGLWGKGEYVGKGKDPAEISQTDDSYLGTNNFPYFSQFKDYSMNKKKPELSETGCGPTSAAMVLSKVTGKMITPNEVANDSYNAGVYDTNGSTDTMFPYIGNKYGVKVKSVDNFEEIKQYANRGVPMVISGEGGNLYGTDSDGHIVAMFGRNRNGYIVNDPSSINGSKSYDESQLRKGFKQAWIFGDTGYKEDVKDAEQVMLSSKDAKALALEDSNFVGKGSDPTTLTYVNGFPYWSQVAFGGNIKKAGCGPTAAAMVFGQVTGKTLNPKNMCADGKNHGWSPYKGVTNPSGLFNHFGKKFNTSVTYISSLSKTKELAAKGYPLIIDGQCSKSSNWTKNCLLTPYGPNGHYLAMFGKTKDGYVINDPRGSRFSGVRSESQLSTGFKYAFKIGDKTYKIDESKVKKIGSTDGQESSGSSTEGITDDSTSTETANTGDDFFGDMATAALNFSKKLFGFDIDETESSSSNTTTSTSGSECTRYTGTDYKVGKSVKASFTAYYPHNDSMEGGYYDCKGNLLNPAEQTCAAPSDVPVGTKIKISNTGTSLDGKIYTVTDRGGAIKIVNGVYRIDILVSASDYKNFQNCKGNITFMGKDGSNVGKGPDILDLTNPYYGMGEGVDWGYFCDPSKGTISSYFGEKRSQYATARGDHGALDYNIHFQPLYAPKSGTVYSENEHSSYGNSLTIKTNSGNTFYRVAHMKSKKVKKGDTVKQGQLLGISGATGHVTGPHVHLEVLKGGTSKSGNGVDPLNYYTETKDKRYKLKGSSLSFKEYMDKIGGEITEVNDSSDETTDTTSNETTVDTVTSSANDFFGDMVTAALNFSKKLFGFDIDEPTTTTDSTTENSSSSEYNSSSSDESNISAKNVAEKILKFTKSKGASDAASAGVLGNAWCESSYNPKAEGKDKTGTYFGLFQWIRKYNQFDKLQKLAKSMNLEWSDTDAQMAFLWQQLQDSTHKKWLNQQYPNKGLSGFLNETNPYDAGSKFNKFFERGVGGGTRAKTSQTIYKKYLKDGKLVNFENFVSTGKGDDESYGKGDGKVKLSSKIIEYALSFLNKGFYYSQPNRDYINKNKNASDCSSFTHHIFDRAAGTEIGGYTEEQYLSSKGSKVKKNNLKPGDIILFKNTRSNRNGTTKYKDNVSHSSLYLGDNKYIESTISDSSGFSGIRVGNLGSNWSQNHWLTGKRFINGDKEVSPTIKNPNKLTKFTKATGSYTLPEASVGNYSASHNGTSSEDNTSTGSTANDFFGDMVTAALNFSKKLFGFDIGDTVSDTTTDNTTNSISNDGNDLNSGADYSSVKTKVSSSDFDKSVILGDSIAKGFKDMKVLPSNRVVATVGDTVAKGISDGNVSKAAAKKPPVIITHYGTNDADWISGGGSFNADWYSNQYTKLINKIKKESPKSKIVLTQTFTPSGGTTKKWVPVVQKALPNIASKNSVNIVDSRSIDKPSYRGSDHIHPISKEFYTKWLADIKSKITSDGKGEDLTADITKDIDSYFQDTLDGIKSSDFGIRDNEFHTGVDYAAKENTPIKSPVSGKVVENIKDKKYGFGNTLVVRDKKGIDHRFAHMKDQSSYGLGTKIRQNDIIGNVGSTGRSTGSHLHYEVTDNGKSINPSKYFDKTAHGGTKNSLDKVTLSFPDSDQKVDANISNLNKGIDEKVLKQLITIIVSVLNKVAKNTENIKEVVDLLTEIQKSIIGKSTTKTTISSTNKASSDTDKTKTQKIFSLLQKGMNSTDNDTSNTQAILDILEILATE